MVMVKVQQEQRYYAYQYAKLQHTSSRTLHSILEDYGCVLKEHLLDTNTATHRICQYFIHKKRIQCLILSPQPLYLQKND